MRLLGPLRVVSLGGGVSGIQLAKFLPEQLNNVSLTIYEQSPELGGTWYDNRSVFYFISSYLCADNKG